MMLRRSSKNKTAVSHSFSLKTSSFSEGLHLQLQLENGDPDAGNLCLQVRQVFCKLLAPACLRKLATQIYGLQNVHVYPLSCFCQEGFLFFFFLNAGQGATGPSHSEGGVDVVALALKAAAFALKVGPNFGKGGAIGGSPCRLKGDPRGGGSSA